jgi:hypothetical protein
MNGFVGFLGAHGDFAVNLSVPVDRARQLRFKPNGGAPSCVPVPDRGFEPGIPPALGRERLHANDSPAGTDQPFPLMNRFST